MMDSNHNSIARAITKSIGIDCSPQQVFEFLADGANWPLWAIVNIRSIRKADDPEWWDMVTIHGPARLRCRRYLGKSRFGPFRNVTRLGGSLAVLSFAWG